MAKVSKRERTFFDKT